MKPDKLIHIPPQQLDPNISDALDRLDKKRQFWIQYPAGIDHTKPENREAEATTEWDDNEQHTEQSI